VTAEKDSPATVLLTYALIIGWTLRKFLRKRPVRDLSGHTSSEFSAPKRLQSESVTCVNWPLESLSGSSEGDAALDRLSRLAAREESRSEAANLQVAADSPAPGLGGIRDTEDEVLKRQSLDSELFPGWHRPTPERLPVPTFAPAIMAMGIVFFVMGIVTKWYVCVAAIIVFAVATWLWVAELQGE
jgi:hypothetical protein